MTETAPFASAARIREAALHGQRTRPRRAVPPPRERGPRQLLKGLLRTARPRQWVKNVLVIAAPAAAGRLFSTHALTQLALLFALFTACAAAVYLINDARDAEADRAHPTKRHRPVAAGQVPVPVAYAVGGALAVLTPAAATWLASPAVAALLAAYIGMQLAYCVSLKHVLVVDLAVVTTGFLMRAMVGGLALGIPLSRWFLITTGFGALFMVSAKRYSEAVQMAGKAGATRALLTEYTPGYLRFVWQLAAGVAVLGYCLWALEGAASRTRACCPGVSCPWSPSSWRSCATPSSPTAAPRVNPRRSSCATGHSL